jgi:hypothetical protein
MAEVAKKKGAKVPGNWREGPFSSLYPVQDPKINAEKIKKENEAGRSLGQWGPSQGVVVMTIEVNEQYASDSPVKHPSRTTELEAHAAALKEIFVGPPKRQPASLSPAAALLGLMAAVPAAGPFGLALMAIALGLTIEQALQQAGATKGQPAGRTGAPAGGGEAQRQIATPLRRLDRWPLGWPAAVGAGTHYTLADGVTLSTDIETKVAEIAADYYASRSKDIVVTSGTRSAASQAEAMYVKLQAGDDILKLYGNKTAAKAVKRAYDDGTAAKQPRAAVVDAMRQVLEGQIAADVYLSKHLKAGAVDVRSRDMTAADKTAFRKAAKGQATKIILETTPPHWHLQF